ncbi:MAG: FprA family A-type flavoprotein [Candidatus Omnitrophica bacterium]|nr:FprA family A-type flavoprotein [Candidatus Omnitrophota bacterium]
MKPLEIKNNIFWVGAIDWNLRNFHGYLTQRGSSYNAYLIVDDKITLVDTVKESFFDEMLTRIKEVIDPEKIDYIVSNHTEMDHSGSIAKMLKIAKKAQVISSPNGEKGLLKHFNQKWNSKVVTNGESLNIGSRNLSFFLTPMVHWPDSMVTYVEKDSLLLSNDAFGQHIASLERFDDELGLAIAKEEAAKYYANIVLPYANQVNKALTELSGLSLKLICPSHGLIWRENIELIIDCYKAWAANKTVNKAVIVYDTMWHSTEKIAQTINQAFVDLGINSRLMNLQFSHISDIMAEILDARYVCVGSPTLNNQILPTVGAFLTYLKGLAPKNRIGLAFGSYGWGGQSISQIEEILKESAFETLDKIKVNYVPHALELIEIKEKLIKNLKEVQK